MEERRHDYPEIREKLGRIEERLIAVDKRINGSIDTIEKHLESSDKPGGFRDRVVIAEQAIAALRTSVWKTGITAGFMGALIGNIAPEAIKLISQWLVGRG